MNAGNEERHLRRVHDYGEMEAAMETLQALRERLAIVNKELLSRFRVAPS
jgi:hypothetical protein